MNSVMRSFIKPRDLESSQEFLMNHNPFIFFLAEEKDNQDSVQMMTTMPFSRRNNLKPKVQTHFLGKLTCFNGINGPRHLSIIIKTSTLLQENISFLLFFTVVDQCDQVLTAVVDLISKLMIYEKKFLNCFTFFLVL